MKMTNREDINGDSAYDSRLAAYLAVHLVKKILDDACVIANAAADSGQPWRYQTVVKEIKCEAGNKDIEDVSYKGENDIVNENKTEPAANTVATSTPQKVTGDVSQCKLESSIIGQGDEFVQMGLDKIAKPTSMFINHLFDMSEVEKAVERHEIDIRQINFEYDVVLQEVTDIMDIYFNMAMDIVFEQACQQKSSGDTAVDQLSSAEQSEYSFLSDAFGTDIGQDMTFYIQDVEDTNEIDSTEVPHIVPLVEITEIHEENSAEFMRRNDIARLENAYLSLNRDYEQCSEDNGNVIIEDTKGMTLQEVQLLTANSSDENLSQCDGAETQDKYEKSKELTAISAVSAASRRSLVSRCRSQGAKLLACLRGWWRRRTPGQRKEHQRRVAGAARGLCPLSPDARRRAASLIDHRLLRSPYPSRSAVWKFNTVNESVVNSSRWKEYTFDEQQHEYRED